MCPLQKAWQKSQSELVTYVFFNPRKLCTSKSQEFMCPLPKLFYFCKNSQGEFTITNLQKLFQTCFCTIQFLANFLRKKYFRGGSSNFTPFIGAASSSSFCMSLLLATLNCYQFYHRVEKAKETKSYFNLLFLVGVSVFL